MSLNTFYGKAWLQKNWKLTVSLLAVIALAGGGLFYCRGASAATVTVSWQNPTNNLDGSSIPATGDGSLTSTRIEYGSCSGAAFAAKLGEFSVAAPAVSVVSPDLAPGTYCFRAFAKNTFGSESDTSNVATKVILPPKPAPPVLSVVNTVAYAVAIKKFRLVLGQPIGTVPLGTACIKDTELGRTGYFAVPYGSVKVTVKTSAPVFLAKCAVG